MKYNYDILSLAEKVRKAAACEIASETSVIQPDERRIEKAMDIVKLCTHIINDMTNSRRSGNSYSDGEVADQWQGR